MNNSTDYPVYEYDDDVTAVLNAGIYINNYYLWAIFAFGFPGNVASVITIIRMQRITTSTFYVAVLAVVDNCAIVFKLLYHQLTLHQVWLDSMGCKILNFLSLFFTTFANWILVFIATERFVAVRKPLKVGMYWTIPRAVVSVGGLTCVVTIIYCHIFWTFTGNGPDCMIFLQYLHFYRDVWYWLNAAVYSLAPCFLLITLNFFIVQSVRKSTIVRNQLSMKNGTKSCNSSRSMRQEKQITVMLVSVAVVFIILTVPRCIYAIVHLYWSVQLGTMADAQKYLLDQLTFFLCDSNHAINFYLYFTTGKKFRRHFLDIVLCRKRRMTALNVSQSGTTMTLHTYKLTNLENRHVKEL
ncbi:sex peptide receptor-like isoform X2 [Haliotis cracherodii]|uniref:sex peptide receptor-like isoform X2 n=1 Tax=Haliotis cracherodii TaxID=6455 RepID=UPI0039E73491